MDRDPLPNLPARALIVGLLAVSAPGGSPVADEPVVCGGTYTVASGDTLSAIAARAYGDGGLASAIYSANQAMLRDANTVRIGDQLLVPCLEGRWPQTVQGGVDDQSAASTIDQLLEPTGTTAPAKAPLRPGSGKGALRIVSGAGLTSFAGNPLNEGGLVADLMRRAIATADDDHEVIVSFVNDWDTHLEDLLPGGDVDVSVPWVRPDCDRPESLSGTTRQLCENFTFSRPLVEVTVAYFERAKDLAGSAASGERLVGRRVCIPWGTVQLDLEIGSRGALPQTAPTAEACFVRLKAGGVDLVAMPQRQAEAVIRRMGFRDSIAEIGDLRTVRALYAVALRGSPAGESAIELIDRGLGELMMSGDWFNIVATHQRQDAAFW